MNKTTKTIGKCRKCNDIIETAHAREFKWCKCGASALDGRKKIELAVFPCFRSFLLHGTKTKRERTDGK